MSVFAKPRNPAGSPTPAARHQVIVGVIRGTVRKPGIAMKLKPSCVWVRLPPVLIRDVDSPCANLPRVCRVMVVVHTNSNRESAHAVCLLL
jgi:hypothetical protein